MPLLKSGRFEVDYLDAGRGPAVVLVHSAASNYKQWRRLVENYSDRYRFLALNLFGYGETTAWPGEETQTMADQVGLVRSVCELVDGPLYLVGHSFGGAIAACTAKALGERVNALVMLEANPFPLLEEENNHGGHDEVMKLKKIIRKEGAEGNWESVAHRFVDYWLGEDAWDKLAEDRRKVFIAALPNNYHEWDAIMGLDMSEDDWRGISIDTLYIRAKETTNSITGIFEVFQRICPQWQYLVLDEGGHMAPMTHPELVNPHIIEFIDQHAAG